MDVIFIIAIILLTVTNVMYWTVRLHQERTPSGTFVIDFSDPLKDVCRLELDEDLNKIYKKKRIVLDIKVYDENSQI